MDGRDPSFETHPGYDCLLLTMDPSISLRGCVQLLTTKNNVPQVTASMLSYTSVCGKRTQWDMSPYVVTISVTNELPIGFTSNNSNNNNNNSSNDFGCQGNCPKVFPETKVNRAPPSWRRGGPAGQETGSFP